MASVLYGVAIRHGAMEANPIRDIPHTERPGRRLIDPLKAQRGVLRLSEISTILRAARRAHGADFFDALLFAGGLFLGARIGELAGARWMDYDRAVRPLGALTLGRQFHVKSGTFRGTKDGMAKVIPVHPVLAGLLERVPVLFRQLADRGLVETDPLFPFFPRLRNGEPSGELRHWNQRTALVRWKEFQRAELPPAPDGWRNVHGLRHSFVTRLRAAGADPHAVRSLTHPATLRTSGDAHLAYVHVDWDGLCAAVKALDFSKEVTGPVQIALDLNKAG
jgi:integrase